MKDKVIEINASMEYIAEVIDVYSKIMTKVSRIIKYGYYIKMGLTTIIPILVVFNIPNRDTIVVVITAIITVIEFYLKFNRCEEKLVTLNRVTSEITLHNELLRSKLDPYHNKNREKLYIERMVTLIYKTDLEISHNYNYSVSNPMHTEK